MQPIQPYQTARVYHHRLNNLDYKKSTKKIDTSHDDVLAAVEEVIEQIQSKLQTSRSEKI
jgi:hypothetical protein